MNWTQTENYLDLIARRGMKPGLERMRRIMQLLGHPEKKFRSVHVAGTNGKGSVCAMVENIARQAGISTGLYTSPHLVDLTERIRVDGRCISRSDLSRWVARIRRKAVQLEPEITYFEMITAAAFGYFAERGVELAIVETGMGGRLDATNVLTLPDVCVITSIGMDHMDHLGRSLERIAAEKAGIVKKRSICVADANLSSLKVIRKASRKAGAKLRLADWPKKAILPDCGLKGHFQKQNIVLALTVVDALIERGCPIDDQSILDGLRTVRWPCRFEWREISAGKFQMPLLLDGAHNSHAISALTDSLRALPIADQKALLIFNALTDKDVSRMLKLLLSRLKIGRIFVPILDTERSNRPSEIKVLIKQLNPRIKVSTFTSAAELAHTVAKSGVEPSEKWILATGSLYLVGRLQSEFCRLQHTEQAEKP